MPDEYVPDAQEVPKDQVQTDPEDVEIVVDLDDVIDWNARWNSTSVEDLESYINSIESGGWNIGSGSEMNTDNLATSSINGIFGLPYQFSTTVDPRVSGTEVGRKYMEKILSVMPVLFLTPGEPAFMQDYDNSEKNRIAQALVDLTEDDDFEDLGDGRYYSFNSNLPEYCSYANIALRALSQYMGISDVEMPTANGGYTKLKNIRVQELLNEDFQVSFGDEMFIPFYVDAETSISESFSNETTESMLSQTANKFSSTAREIQFMLGSHDPGGIAGAVKDVLGNGDLLESLGDAVGNIASAFVGKGMISRLSSELTTIVSGGKIVFPEIWGGSSYTRNYSITLKLRSPDPDPLSIFINIYLPIILLVSMAAPRQLGGSANSYESPFLVRAIYKSIFSCDLGIITSLDISRGGEDRWNTMGMPVTADVTVNIKDMYSNMSISKAMGLLNNTAQMDYLALMAGVAMQEYEPFRMVALGSMIISNIPRDFILDKWGGFKHFLNRTAMNVLGGLSDTRFVS